MGRKEGIIGDIFSLRAAESAEEEKTDKAVLRLCGRWF
jgi:hypothetical protein